MSVILKGNLKYLLAYALAVILILTPLNLLIFREFSKDSADAGSGRVILSEKFLLESTFKEFDLDAGKIRKINNEVLQQIAEKPKVKVRVVVISEEREPKSQSGSGRKSRNKRVIASAAADISDVAEIASHESTVGIYPDRKYHLLSDGAPYAESLKFFQAGIRGNGIKIAVLDTGINPESFNIVKESVFTGEGSSNDALNHGTQIASVIHGIAPEASFLNVKVLNDAGEGYTSQIVQGILWSIENGAGIIVMSFGHPNSEIDVPLDEAIKAAVSKGVIVVAAAGNCGNGCPSKSCGGYVGVTSPGNSPHVITAGAADQNNNLACFSSHGKINGVIKPDIVAPLSGGQSGTSISAAYAAGAAALMAEAYPGYKQSDIRELFAANAVDAGEQGNDGSFGHGLLKIEALASALPAAPEQKDEETPIAEPPAEENPAPVPEINNTNQTDEAADDAAQPAEKPQRKYSSLATDLTPRSPEEYSYYYLTYDKNGNLLKSYKQFYEYNPLNQLIRVKEGDENGFVLEEYAYDEEGSRIKKVEFFKDGTNRTFYYPSGDFMQTIDASGIHNTTYIYEGTSLAARIEDDGTKFFYHLNHLGSTDIVTDEAGNIVEKTEYYPFGAALSGGNDRFTFTGQENDATELMYYGARYYDPILMHFTQPDTMLPDVYDPQQLNRYSYVRNNPVNYNDPSGHWINIAGGFVIGFGANVIKQIVFDGKSIFDGTVDYKEAAAWGIGGAVAGATFGLGTVAAGSGYAGYIAGGAIAGFSGGRATQLSDNLLHENSWNQDLANFGDIAVETVSGGVLGGVGKGVTKLSQSISKNGLNANIPKKTSPSFRNSEELLNHFKNHGPEMGYKDPISYEQGAKTFLTGRPQIGTAQMIRSSDQSLVRYQFSTQRFGVLDADQTTIKTYMIPHKNPVKSYEYYLRQVIRGGRK